MVGKGGILEGIAKEHGFDIERDFHDLNLDQCWWCKYDVKSGSHLPKDSSLKIDSSTGYRYVVGIEHEFTTDKIMPDLYKFLHLNVPVKVLITYLYRDEGRGRTFTWSWFRAEAKKICVLRRRIGI